MAEHLLFFKLCNLYMLFGSQGHKCKCKGTGHIFPFDGQPESHTSSAAKYHSHLSKNNIFVAVEARNFLKSP